MFTESRQSPLRRNRGGNFIHGEPVRAKRNQCITTKSIKPVNDQTNQEKQNHSKRDVLPGMPARNDAIILSTTSLKSRVCITEAFLMITLQ